MILWDRSVNCSIKILGELMRKIIKENNWWKTGAYFVAFLSIFLICFSIFFTPNFVVNHLSSDGILEPVTIYEIYCIRLGSCIIGAMGFIIGVLYITKPGIFKTFYSNPDQIWKPRLKLMLFLFPIVFVIYTVLLKIYHPDFYRVLMWRENSIIEWLTFICYFIAFVVSFSISITYYKSNQILFCLMYMVLTLGLLFIAGEEISWGQRLLHLKTPAFWAKYNDQNEITIHNIKGLGFTVSMSYVIVGFYGAFSRLIIPKKIKNKYNSVVNLFVPDYYLFFYFFIVGFLYLYYDRLSEFAASLFGDWAGITHIGEVGGVSHFLIGKDQEPAEFLLSCGFLLFVIINKYRQVSNKNFGSVVEKNKTLKKTMDN